MRKAAAELDFEQAAMLRDKMIEINKYIYEDKKSKQNEITENTGYEKR